MKCLKIVEPILFLSMFMWALEVILMRSLIYETACNGIYSDCTFLRSKHMNDNQTLSKRNTVQQSASQISTIIGIVGMIMPTFTSFYFALDVDKGRFIGSMTFPMFNYVLGIFFLIFFVSYELKLEYLYLACFLKSICGGEIVYLMSCFSYIVNHASTESVSWRIILAETITTVGFISGSILGGYIVDGGKYTICLIIIICLCFVCVVYPMVVLTDFPQQQEPTSLLGQIKPMFALLSSTNPSRKWLLGYMALYLVIFFAYEGFFITSYLYVSGDPFVMSNLDYSLLIAAIGIGTFVFGLIGGFLLHKRIVSINKLSFGVGLFTATGFILFGLARSRLVLFIGTFLIASSSLNMANSKSILVSLVNVDQNGRLFAMLYLFKNFFQLMIISLILQAYSASLKVDAGIVYFIFTGFSLMVCVVFIFLSAYGSSFLTYLP